MNKEKVLSILLSLLSLALAVVPIIAAFAAHGWDYRATVMSDTSQVEDLFSASGLENMGRMGEFQVFGDLSSFNPTDHYVRSWEQAESKLVTDLGNVLGYVDLGNAGAHAGHAPSYDILGAIGCKGHSTPDFDDADPTKDCVNQNDGSAPVFDFSASPGSLSTSLPMTIPAIVGRDDPTNAVVVRSSIDEIKTAFLNAGWEFYYPDEGYTSAEPHTPIGEIADAFLDDADNQYHIRIFYGGRDGTYGDWYYMGAHYEGQNAVPSIGAPMTFNNPFNFLFTVNDITADVRCAIHDVNLGQARLQQQTVIPAGGQGSINVIMGFTYEGLNHLLANHLSGTSINTSLKINGTMGLDIYGITITMTLEQTVLFPSDIPVVI